MRKTARLSSINGERRSLARVSSMFACKKKPLIEQRLWRGTPFPEPGIPGESSDTKYKNRLGKYPLGKYREVAC